MEDKRSFEDILKQAAEIRKEREEEKEADAFPLSDALDAEIIMHREAHFGGRFDVMLEYYRGEGKGVNPEFQIRRIEELAELELLTKENLAPFLLTGAHAEKIAEVKKKYKQLRELYEHEEKMPKLIADLIFSEDQEGEKEVAALAAEGKKAVPALIDLLRTEEFHDPLFPGYGQAPFLAALCLGKIGDARALYMIFGSLGEGDIHNEKMVLRALKLMGDPAREFLFKVLKGKPYGEDNEKAALALIEFVEDPLVASECLSFLQTINWQENPLLTTYLVLVCEGLKDPKEQEKLEEIGRDPALPSMVRRDIEAIVKDWNTKK